MQENNLIDREIDLCNADANSSRSENYWLGSESYFGKVFEMVKMNTEFTHNMTDNVEPTQKPASNKIDSLASLYENFRSRE